VVVPGGGGGRPWHALRAEEAKLQVQCCLSEMFCQINHSLGPLFFNHGLKATVLSCSLQLPILMCGFTAFLSILNKDRHELRHYALLQARNWLYTG